MARGDSSLTALGESDDLIDQLLGEAEQTEARTACPVLLVGLGGTGASVLRRVKPRMRWLGMSNVCRFLVVDTDDTEKKGFDDDEFCYLSMTRARTVLKSPEDHQWLARRLDLGNSQVLQRLRRIGACKLPGAFQVRPLGLLALYANYDAFVNKLHGAVGELIDHWAALRQRLTGNVQIKLQNRFYVILVGSVCGGTGSSTVIDVAAIVRHELAAQSPDVAAFLTLADVYEERVRGRREERQRMMVNTYATIREIDSFQTSGAAVSGVELGLEEGAVPVPELLFERTYLVERKDAEGQDLGSTEAVFDTLALHVTADVGSTVGGKMAAANANNLASSGLAPCPRTGRDRLYSTVGATALAIPVKRLARYCVYRQLATFVNETVLGRDLSGAGEEVEEAVNNWLLSAQIDTPPSPDADLLASRLRGAAVTSLEGYVNQLFQKRAGKVTVYHKDSKFTSVFDHARRRWDTADLPKIKQDLSSHRDTFLEKARKDLDEQIGDSISNGGLRHAQAFLVRLKQIWEETAKQLTAEVGDDLKKAKEWDGIAKTATDPLRTFFGSMGTDKPRQEKTAQAFRNALDYSVRAETKRLTAQIVARLVKDVDRRLDTLTKAIDSAEHFRAEVDRLAIENRAQSRAISADSSADVDVATAGFFAEFFAEHSLSASQLIDGLTKKLRTDTATVLTAIGRDRHTTRELLEIVAHHFITRIPEVNIVELLEQQLGHEDRDVRRMAQARVKEAIAACRPLWQAEIGKIDCQFADTVILGVPEMDKDRARKYLDETIKSAEAALARDVRYQASVHVVDTFDRQRIYAVRSSHGGRPHYLLRWPEYRKAYESWRKKDPHPVHVFPAKTVDKIPSLEPVEGATEGELAFALGLAYGWIAVRGRWYYFNVERRESSRGRVTYEMPVDSDWDGIAFQDRQPRTNSASLQELKKQGTLRFAQQPKAKRERRLGDGGRGEALAHFIQTSPAVKQIFELFDELRNAAGDGTVSRELAEYVESLPNRVRHGDVHYDQVMREVELLRQQVDKLRPGAA